MKALQFDISVPKFIAAKGLGALFGKWVHFKGPTRSIKLIDIDEPDIPSDEWVKLKTLYCGFCGSDLNLMLLHDSPTASPFTSFPCVPGHEVVAEIVELGRNASGFKQGDRVVVNPALSCVVRDIEPLCKACRSGRSANCENLAEGAFSPGMFLGICSDLNGGFAPYLVAHKSQLYKIPEGVSLESASLVEPFAVALQSVFDNPPEENERVLVIGGGVIGNLIIQSLKLLQPNCEIAVIEPSHFAAGFAKEVGANKIISPGNIFKETANLTSSKVYKPLMGMDIMMGGFDKIYDTVGSSNTLNLSMRVLSNLGTLSIVGIGSDVKLDLTPLWLKLQTIKGVFAYGEVLYQGEKRHVYDVVLELIQEGKADPGKLVTHKFSLENYQDLIEVNLNKSRHQAIKSVFSFI